MCLLRSNREFCDPSGSFFQSNKTVVGLYDSVGELMVGTHCAVQAPENIRSFLLDTRERRARTSTSHSLQLRDKIESENIVTEGRFGRKSWHRCVSRVQRSLHANM